MFFLILNIQDIFKNQWHKRRAYYVKQNYDILMTDSPTYDAHNPVEWMPNHVAKNAEAKNADAKANKAKSSDADQVTANAKGWAGLPRN